MSGTLDLDNIDSIHFMYANNKSGKFVVDNIKLIGATSDPTPSIKAVNSTDLLMLKRYILKSLELGTSEQEEKFKKAADLNRDNKVDSTDLTILKRYLLKAISEIPI